MKKIPLAGINKFLHPIGLTMVVEVGPDSPTYFWIEKYSTFKARCVDPVKNRKE